MASIGGLSGTTSNGASSIRGYGGLASGLDRDTLIEQMTYGTRSKIAKQKQEKELLGWEQEALRNITDKAFDYTYKFTSYASPSNLTGSNLFSRSQITAMGENSKFVGVTGRATTADILSVMGIKQLAEDAKIMGKQVSSGILSTGAFKNDFNETTEVNQIEGQMVGIKHGGRTYYVTFDTGADYDYRGDLAGALNKSFSEVKIQGDKKLSDVLEASVVDGKITLKNLDDSGNSIEVVYGSGDVLEKLGILNHGQSLKDLNESSRVIGNGGTITAQNEAEVVKDVKISDFLKDKTMNVSYNGTRKELKFSEGLTSINDLQADLQKQLDKAYGKNRVQVSISGTPGGTESKLVFKTVKPDGSGGSETDASSIFSIYGGDTGLLGKDSGFFGISEESTNRLNISESLLNSGAANSAGVDTGVDAKLVINGKTIAGVTWNSTIEEIMEAVNADEDLGVKLTYQANSDRFLITSKEKGASGEVKLEGNVAEFLFGPGADGATVKGKDAVVAVQYAGDTSVTEITRDSNSFTVDGLTLSLKGIFGYTGDAVDPSTEAVTFDAKVDTETTTTAVKEMIESFNEILELISKEVKKKPNRDYKPLTDEQRDQMSDTQIEKWEEKAKEGLLFNDTDVRGFVDALRFAIPSADRAQLSKMGISVSTDYSDNGKLVFDENAFRAALESDPEQVRELFTRKREVDADGKEIVASGLMERISTAMNKYAGMTGATKGALVERAGSIHAPTTVIKNSLQKRMDDIDDVIDELLDKLETEEDRYIRQFTSLERLISQMNSQSSYFAQFSGGM